MQFLAAHPLLVFTAFLTALFFTFRGATYEKLNDRVLALCQSKTCGIALLIAGFVFYVVGYLTKPVYYTNYMGGVIGDNYGFVGMMVRPFSPDSISVGHMYFPLIPNLLFKFVTWCGIYSKQDPLYFEKAFTFFSLPSRIFVLVGFWAFYKIMRLQQKTMLEAAVGTFFLASTFGFWFWPLQSNAIGVVIPFIVLTFYVTMQALRTRRTSLVVCSALLTALCFYVHISSTFIVASMGAFTAIVLIYRVVKEKESKAAVQLALYGIIAASFAFFYLYVIMDFAYGTRSLSRSLAIMSDRDALGVFSWSNFLSLFVRDGVSTNMSLLLGIIRPGPSPFAERAVIWVQFAAFFFLIASVFKNRTWSRKSLPLLLVAFVFLGCLAGFSMRKTWFQYYSIITPVTALLFVLLTLAPRNVLAFTVLILANIGMNGLGPHRVMQGRFINDDIAYRTITALKEFSGGKPVLFLGPSNSYPYNFKRIMSYYNSTGSPFEKTSWKDISAPEMMADEISRNDLVLLEPKLGELYLKMPPPHFSASVVKLNSADFPEAVQLKRVP